MIFCLDDQFLLHFKAALLYSAIITCILQNVTKRSILCASLTSCWSEVGQLGLEVRRLQGSRLACFHTLTQSCCTNCQVYATVTKYDTVWFHILPPTPRGIAFGFFKFVVAAGMCEESSIPVTIVWEAGFIVLWGVAQSNLYIFPFPWQSCTQYNIRRQITEVFTQFWGLSFAIQPWLNWHDILSALHSWHWKETRHIFGQMLCVKHTYVFSATMLIDVNQCSFMEITTAVALRIQSFSVITV